METMKKLPKLRVVGETQSQTEAYVTREYPLTIILNNQELLTLLCTPKNLDYLTIGFLASQGIINSKEELKKISVDAQKGAIWVETVEDEKTARALLFKKRLITSGGGTVRGAYFQNSIEIQTKVNSKTIMAPHQVIKLVNEFRHYSKLFQVTHGVHSAALCNTDKILEFADDLGRHNALDKVFGACLLKDISTEEAIVITTGRVPSEQILKVAKRKVPIMLSLTVPTDLGVKLADDYGITLVGSIRDDRMDIYTHKWRLPH